MVKLKYFLKVQTVMSGTISAGLVNATNLTVNGIGAGAIKTANLNFNNLNIAENLNVSGNFSLEGFNTYEGSYKAGDVISYIKKGTMTTATANIFFGFVYAGPNSIYKPDTTYDIDFYEMVYWAVDSRSNDTIRQSATVCVPSTIVSSTVVSYKHQTLFSTYQFFTLWQEMENITNFTFNQTVPDFISWTLATTGYVTVCADNPGYGVSLGNYNFTNPTGESMSQYNAVVALKQLIEKQPDIFKGTSFPTPLKVISTGYSIGGNFCPLVSELIALDTSFKLVNTIAGAPINTYEVMNAAAYGDSSGQTLSTNVTSLLLLFIILLLVNTNNNIYGPLFNIKPNITYGVVPFFEQLYLDSPKIKNLARSPYGLFPLLIRYVQNATGGKGIVDASGNSYNYTEFNTTTNPPYIKTSEILNVPNNNLELGKQLAFFTNIFEDFSDLSGTPINIMYSQQDQLSCYNPLSPYLGSAETDQIAVPIETFITTDNSGNGGFNGLNRTNYTDTTVDASQNSLTIQMENAAATLVNSENTNNCSNTRWNTLPLGENVQEHFNFGYRIFQTVVRKYLLSRPLN